MDKRKAFMKIDSNVASVSRGRSRLPRMAIGSNLTRRRKFASTSKTPKISNCANMTPPMPPTDNNTSKKRKTDFVTTRNHRSHLETITPFRLATNNSPFIERHSSMSKKKNCAKNGASNSHLLIIQQDRLPDEDMDLRSDSDELMSPEDAPQPLDYKVTQSDLPNLYSRGIQTKQTQDRNQAAILSDFLAQPTERRSATLTYPSDIQNDLRHSANLLKTARDTPADNPVIFSKILQSGSNNVLVGTEIGGSVSLRPESLDESDITHSTIINPQKQEQKWTNSMPTFEPQDEFHNRHPEKSKSLIVKENQMCDDLVEEYSLPDVEVNKETAIEIDGKLYIHRKLDPGWTVKVSKTRQKPYYVHPDFGTTWQCPNSLPPKSKARVFRRVTMDHQPKLQESNTVLQNDSISPNATATQTSEMETMSELLNNWSRLQQGYEGSISSQDQSRTEAKIPKVISTKLLSNTSEDLEWITPLRDDIETPVLQKSCKQSSSSKSNPVLSTIKETKYSDLHTETVAASEHKKKTTPRVSFEPLEMTSNSKDKYAEKSSSQFCNSLQESPASPLSDIRSTGSRCRNLGETEQPKSLDLLPARDDIIASIIDTGTPAKNVLENSADTEFVLREAPTKRKSIENVPKLIRDMPSKMSSHHSKHNLSKSDPLQRCQEDPSINTDEWSPQRKMSTPSPFSIAGVADDDVLTPVSNEKFQMNARNNHSTKKARALFEDVQSIVNPNTELQNLDVGYNIEVAAAVNTNACAIYSDNDTDTHLHDETDFVVTNDVESPKVFSPPILKQQRKKYNWRIMHPFHPICSLQRLDELLKEQRKKEKIQKQNRRRRKSSRGLSQKKKQTRRSRIRRRSQSNPRR